jgi:hypothetical protein
MTDEDAGPQVSVYDEASGWRVLSVPRTGVRFRPEPLARRGRLD